MNILTITNAILISVAQVISIITYAEPHHQEHINHIHGLSEIQLAIEDEEIAIHFQSPASNIVGFEHLAKSSKEIEQVKNAKAILSTPTSLFSFNGANCKAISSLIDVSGLMGTQDGHTQHSTHKEMTADYHFNCESASNLKSINIDLFTRFPNITNIKAQWVSTTGQGISVLRPKNNQLIIQGNN